MTKTDNLAAILTGKRSTQLLRLNDPPLSAHQVRVRIHSSAICGTQLGEWNQTRGPDPYLPHCFGHEAVGRILEVGESVEGVQPGDRVVVSWMKTAAKSDGPPKFVDVSGATINFGECCTFLTRGVFPANRVVKIDETVEASDAALLGCAFLTAYAAIKRVTEGLSRFDREVAIVGAGGIGLSAALLAKAFGMTCTSIDRPNVIESIKADRLDIPLLTTTEAASGDRAFSHVIVCSGAVAAFELAEKLLPRNAGSMYIVGNPPQGIKVGFDVKPLLYGRQLIGIGEKDVDLPKDLYALIDLIKSGRLNAGQLIRRKFPLSKIQDALEVADSGVGGRTLIEIDDQMKGPD